MFSYLYLMVFALQAIATPQSLIGLVKSNPQALVNVAETADGKAVARIIDILRSMILENEQNIGDLDQQLAQALQDVRDAEQDFDGQEGICDTLNANLTEARKEMNYRQGKFDEASLKFSVRQPVLISELKTLRMVLTKLKSLLPSGGASRQLLSLSAESVLTTIKEDPTAFLESLADADPKKLQSAVDLVQQLIDEAAQELNDVTVAKDDALTALNSAQKLVNQLVAEVGTCESRLGGKKEELEVLQAVLEQTRTFVTRRKKILNGEIGDINAIIQLLTPLKE